MKYLRNIIGGMVLIVALYYFITVLLEQRHIFFEIENFLSIYSILPIFLFTIAVLMSGYLWGEIVSDLLNTEINNLEAVKVHSLSWILKYLPGQAGSLLNKLNWAHSYNYNKIAVSSSFIYENLFLLTSSIILSVPIILLFNGLLYEIIFGIALVTIVGLSIYINSINRVKLFNYFSFLSKNLLKKDLNERYFLGVDSLLKFNLYYFIPRLLNGIGFALILYFIIPINPFYFLVSASIYILAGVVGLAAIFVPSGIGVREAVIVFFVSMFADQDVSILISVLSRAYSLISDIFILFIYLILKLFIR